MSLIDKIFNKEEKKKEIKLQQGVNTVQTVIEESESQKEAARKAVNAAIEEIQTHPEMPVGEFMKRLQKNTDLSDADLVKIIKQLPDVKSEEATVAAVEATDLSSPKIAEILEETPISPNAAQKIAKQIPDEDIKKEQQAKIEKELEERERQKAIEEENKILKELSHIYSTCDDISDSNLAPQIQKFNITLATLTPNIKSKLLDIIAKRTALDCMKYGGPKISTLSTIMSVNEDLLADMFDANLPKLALKEYKNLKESYDQEGKPYHEYGQLQQKYVQEQLLNYLAKKSARTFDDIGDFNIPQTERFSQLSTEERNFFINKIKTFSKSSLDQSDESMLIRQLNGNSTLNLQNLNKILEKMSPKERDITMQRISDLLKSNQNEPKSKSMAQREIDQNIEYMNSKIRQLPSSQQLIATKAICNALDQQQESIKLLHKNTSVQSNSTNSSNDELDR